MPIAKITGQGLAAIAVSVGLLWGCIIVEHLERRDALRERARVMREVELIQHTGRRGHPLPVSIPSPGLPLNPHFAAG